MRTSTILAIAASTLATAAPSSSTASTHKFAITNFVFGCSASCSYNFDVAIQGQSANHPAVTTPVHCEGNLDTTTDYAQCGEVSSTQAIYAYIVKATNELKLEYEVQEPAKGEVFRYYGNRTVYSATGDDADLQKPSFKVKESYITAVA